MSKGMNRRHLMLGAAAIGAAGVATGRRARAQTRTKIRVGLVPLISSGPIFVAQAKGFFEKVGLDVELKYFADGALAIPALIAGELDTTVSTLNAGLFNAVSRGAPYKLILDRGSEKPGSGSMTIAASRRPWATPSRIAGRSSRPPAPPFRRGPRTSAPSSSSSSASPTMWLTSA